MTPITTLLLLVIGPVLALVVGSLGVALIEETVVGWLMLLAGVSYPPGAVIYYQHHHRQKMSAR
jgi:hypothetical protein